MCMHDNAVTRDLQRRYPCYALRTIKEDDQDDATVAAVSPP